MLICPVRDCRLPLIRGDNQVACAQGHAFDIARRGYINLLQPQDKRSRTPGDSKTAVAGRARIHEMGATRPLLEGMMELAEVSQDDVVLDAGCGDGFYLGTMQQETGCQAHGVDISTASIDAAARSFPSCEWIVANADRFLPYQDGSFTLAMSITARMNPPEFRRVLKAGGRLLIAIPAPDDLIELRGAGRDRQQRTIDQFSPLFRLKTQRRLTTHADLDAALVEGLRHAIYRPLHTSAAAAMRVTFSLDCFVWV